MSGEDVLRRFWENPEMRAVPIVVLTADATPGVARRMKANGATACLTKPFEVDRVLRLVDELLANGAPL